MIYETRLFSVMFGMRLTFIYDVVFVTILIYVNKLIETYHNTFIFLWIISYTFSFLNSWCSRNIQ